MFRILLIAFVVLVWAAPALSQDEPPELVCTMDQLNTWLDGWQNAVDTLSGAMEAQDVNTVYDVMVLFDQVLDVGRSLCNPLQFEGTGDLVMDPIGIDEGVYRMTFTAVRNDVVTNEVITGDCSGIYAFVDADQTETQETFRSGGCLMLIEVDATGPWSLNFEKLG